MASPISFQGVSSGLQTDKLVAAIIDAESAPVQRLQDRQDLNQARISAYTKFKTDLLALSTSLNSLASSGFDSRSVTSSDSTNAYVTATGSGAAAGSYDVVVSKIATKASLTAANSLTSDTAAPVGQGDYTLTDTDGKAFTVTIDSTNDSLAGLRDAINAKGSNVTASIVQTSASGNAYKLVLTAKNTGSGTAGNTFNLTGAAGNTLGLDSTTGNTSSVADDAQFSVNGVSVTRASNTVSDVVSGVTFTLKKGDASGAVTTLTVAPDKTAITSALQGVVDKFNTLLKDYKANAASGTDSSGKTTGSPGAFYGDPTVRGYLAQIRSVLSGTPAGLSSGNAFQSAADLGISTQQDGTLKLDTKVLGDALDKDPNAARNVFAASGSSSNANLSFSSSTSKTTTGDIAFNVTSYVGGTVSADFTVGGTTYTLNGQNGVLTGNVGTPLEGLVLSVNGTGSGTLSLSQGVSSALKSVSDQLAGPGGSIASILDSINQQNSYLSTQIEAGQTRLDKRKTELELQFSQLESTIAQLNASGQSLGALH